MLIPRKLRRGDLKRYCQTAEDMLNRLTEESEQWAGSKTRCLNEQPLMRRDHLRPSVPPQPPSVVSLFSPVAGEHKNADENVGTFRRAS